MSDLRRVAPALWIVAVLCAALATPASGAVRIGSNLAATADKTVECPDSCTVSSAALPTSSEAPGGRLAPSDGVVVRWRIKVGATTTPVALRITRPGASDAVERTGAGTGPTVTPQINRASTFDVRLPIQAGDALGIDCCLGQPLRAFAGTPNADLIGWIPRLVDGEPPRMLTDAAADNEVLINADIEPDADADGFGDETQDQCPTKVSQQVECDPPETEITKTPANKSKKPKAKYRFTSDEPGSTFECKLKGKGLKKSVKRFNDCSSPRKYKRLDEGKFKFQVRAIDPAGNVDPTPAKDRFKVVG